MSSILAVLKRIVQPLASRKVRVALATVVAAFAVEWGLDVSDQTIYTVLGVGVAVILGIAVEDAGLKSAGGGTGSGTGDGGQNA